MTDHDKLSRRERQIMDIVYAGEGATVHQIRNQLEGEPTPMAVRRLLSILMEKGFLKRQKRGREHVYLPKQAKAKAGSNAFHRVIQTYFRGSIGEALATHLERPGESLSDEDVARLQQLIEDSTKSKRAKDRP
ncbi:MAG: BlaI/MecI/CopY family transcriptional regulator [Planctomycetota bacterium]